MKEKTRIKPLRLAIIGFVIMLAIFVVLTMASAGLIGKNPRVPVLIYHDLWKKASDDQKGFTSVENFASEMEYLYNNGYHVIPLKTLFNHLENGEPLPEKPVVITFDDGYKSNYSLAYPILKKYNMHATIFLIAGFDQCPPDEIHPRLSWDEMGEMQRSGIIDIQAHTFDLHGKVFTDREKTKSEPAVVARAFLPGEDRLETQEEYERRLYDDFLRTREAIETKLKKDVDTMAWPFGAYNSDAIKVARSAGYKYFLSTRMGLNQHGDGVEAIRRISVSDKATTQEFAKLVEPDNFYLRHFTKLSVSYVNYLKSSLSYSI